MHTCRGSKRPGRSGDHHRGSDNRQEQNSQSATGLSPFQTDVSGLYRLRLRRKTQLPNRDTDARTGWRGNAAQALDAPHLRSENIPIQPTPITGCARVLTSETHRPGLTSFRVRLACDLKTLPSEDFQTGKERLKTVEGHTIERLMRPEP
jgi:hypothetical protein